MLSPILDPIEALKAARTVAVVGASTQIYRASNSAVEMLVNDGFRVVPVNPEYESVYGLKCFPDFAEVPDPIEIDIVNIFRRPDAVVELLDQVAARVERTEHSPVVWTQLGVSSPEARKHAHELGLEYIENRCIMVELERLAGIKNRRGRRRF